MSRTLCEFVGMRFFGRRVTFVARKLPGWHLTIDRMVYRSGSLIGYTLWYGPILFILQVESRAIP